MTETVTAKSLLAKHVGRRDRVLLVNPPVQETRYAWLRWNQPLDLLKLGPHLEKKVRCSVELLDLMQPDGDGAVVRQRLPGARQSRIIGEGEFAGRYPMWRYGMPYETIQKWVIDRNAKRMPLPTQVWITSLCSYWYQGVAQVCAKVRQHIPDAKIVLIGNYPRMIPQHARENCPCDLVVTDTVDLDDSPADWALYGTNLPQFGAIVPGSPSAFSEVKAGAQAGITDFAFFADDICADEGESLIAVARKTEKIAPSIRFNVICGLDPRRVTPKVAKALAGKRLGELHFEEASDGGKVHEDAYDRALHYLQEAGAKAKAMSGFVWIGHPHETLEGIIQRSFDVIRRVGTFILKPYTPAPGSSRHAENAEYLSDFARHEDLSPHFFPFAELNGITRDDYNDLYRLAAFLNDKVRGQSFDFLQGTMGLDFLKDSLRREVWNLEPSPLRVTNQPTGL